jgi:transposase-like protein
LATGPQEDHEPMAKPITPEERAAILADIQAGELSRNAIARKHHRSPGTISNIAKENGLDGAAFDRTATAQASRAKQIDNRARRAALVDAYLSDAEKIRERLWEPAEAITAMGEVVYLSKPGARDVRDFVVAGTSLIKTSIDVEKHDTDDDSGAAAVDSWLRHLLGRD